MQRARVAFAQHLICSAMRLLNPPAGWHRKQLLRFSALGTEIALHPANTLQVLPRFFSLRVLDLLCEDTNACRRGDRSRHD